MSSPIEISLQVSPFPDELPEELTRIGNTIFGEMEPHYVGWRLHNMPMVSVLLSRHAGNAVGFKIGYAMSRHKYYSWLGGVVAEHRGQGLASQLMVRQHDWVAAQGFERIETAADQSNSAMSRLNLQHGFQTCGLRAEPGRTQILFTKALV